MKRIKWWLYKVISDALWSVCTWLSPINTDNACHEWYNGGSRLRDKISERLFVLSGAFELASNGEGFEWPSDWKV